MDLEPLLGNWLSRIRYSSSNSRASNGKVPAASLPSSSNQLTLASFPKEPPILVIVIFGLPDFNLTTEPTLKLSSGPICPQSSTTFFIKLLGAAAFETGKVDLAITRRAHLSPSSQGSCSPKAALALRTQPSNPARLIGLLTLRASNLGSLHSKTLAGSNPAQRGSKAKGPPTWSGAFWL